MKTSIRACWSLRPPVGRLASLRDEGGWPSLSSLCREGKVMVKATRKWNMSTSSKQSASKTRHSTFSGINTETQGADGDQHR